MSDHDHDHESGFTTEALEYLLDTEQRRIVSQHITLQPNNTQILPVDSPTDCVIVTQRNSHEAITYSLTAAIEDDPHGGEAIVRLTMRRGWTLNTETEGATYFRPESGTPGNLTYDNYEVTLPLPVWHFFVSFLNDRLPPASVYSNPSMQTIDVLTDAMPYLRSGKSVQYFMERMRFVTTQMNLQLSTAQHELRRAREGGRE
jgi:hypothetical protein